MSKHARAVLLLKTILVLIAILVGVQLATAQSGRRGASSKPASKPAPTPEPEPTPKPREEIPPAYTMVVGLERDLAFDYTASGFFDIVLSACADRLDRSPSVKVQSIERDLSRSEAIKTAKQSTDIHVVWLKLQSELGGVESSANPVGLVVEYSVYAPTTGKMITSGRSYPVQPRGGVLGGLPPNARNNVAYREYLIKQAAEKAAERILGSLDLPAGRSIPAFAQH